MPGLVLAGTEIVGCTKSPEREARGLAALEDKIADLHKSFGGPGPDLNIVASPAVAMSGQGPLRMSCPPMRRQIT